MTKKLTSTFTLLIILTLIGGFLRFYNLNWGTPYFFHPDERNIASAVSQLQFPNQMNPHFFAYGSLPIYAIYFTALLINSLHLSPITYPLDPTFDQAIIISRFYSAFFATMLIPLLFVIARNLLPKQSHNEAHLGLPRSLSFTRNDGLALVAAFLVTTSVGLIQFAHFGTFELWLTFFSVLLFWFCLKKASAKNIILMGIVFGVLIATKVSSLALLPLPFMAILFNLAGRHKHEAKILSFVFIAKFLKVSLLFMLISSSVYVLTNPYVFLDTPSFMSSMTYESSVALGTLPVFYTGEFVNTIPILYHFQNIYPFLLNPLLLILLIPALLYIVYKGIHTKNYGYLLLTAFFLILFVSQVFIFVKWTRYLVPTLPFIYLIIALAISDFFNTYSRTKGNRVWINSLCVIFVFTNILFALSYFITAFIKQDTRLTAKEFLQNNVPPNAGVLSEVYDLGIMPFNTAVPNTQLFNFYDLDSTSLQLRGAGPTSLPTELQTLLANSEYIILPSQRLLKIRLNNKSAFPNGNDFYQSLTNGTLGYTKIYETPCDIFCRITYLGSPVYRFEETANVFERPTVFIFKKVK